jgi:multisubunit Na+/H+ antiporter MnhG subunit
MTNEAAKPTGTVWIVVGAVLLLIGVVQLVTAPAVFAEGDGASIAGKLFGLLVCVGLGVWALVAGLNQRKRSTQA